MNTVLTLFAFLPLLAAIDQEWERGIFFDSKC